MMASRFGADPRAFFEGVYQAPAPWDIGAAQPELLRLIEEWPPPDPILDVGCGTGDLAIALATRGHEVIGVDFVDAAIQQARDRAAGLDAKAHSRLQFVVADGLHPSVLGQPVGAVVDSGFTHLFEHDVRDRFAIELAALLRPGGRYYVLSFAVTFPIENAPLQMDCAEVGKRFRAGDGWRVLACRPAEFLSRVATVPAIASVIERTT